MATGNAVTGQISYDIGASDASGRIGWRFIGRNTLGSILGAIFMTGIFFFLIPLALAATVIILGVGIYSLAKGGAFAKENSNKLMRLRVAAQAIAVGLMMLFLWLSGKGGS